MLGLWIFNWLASHIKETYKNGCGNELVKYLGYKICNCKESLLTVMNQRLKLTICQFVEFKNLLTTIVVFFSVQTGFTGLGTIVLFPIIAH